MRGGVFSHQQSVSLPWHSADLRNVSNLGVFESPWWNVWSDWTEDNAISWLFNCDVTLMPMSFNLLSVTSSSHVLDFKLIKSSQQSTSLPWSTVIFLLVTVRIHYLYIGYSLLNFFRQFIQYKLSQLCLKAVVTGKDLFEGKYSSFF